MRIISWNCRLCFREKRELLAAYDADVLIIPECEAPARSDDEAYRAFAGNHLWIGRNKNKGLGVFAKPGVTMERLPWDDAGKRYFLPVLLNGTYQLIAVWTAGPRYIGEYIDYHHLHANRFTLKTIVMGDFNSNAGFKDKALGRQNPVAVDLLAQAGLASLYHHLSGEEQGKESTPSFYMGMNKEGRVRNLIDHCFAAPALVADFRILSDDSWLEHSDHKPILLDLK